MTHTPPASPWPPYDTELVGRLRRAGCVFAEDEARLLHASTRSRNELDHLVARRIAGEPLEYLLGWAEFAGRRVAVDPGVFVPRRRTEFLVRLAAALTAPSAVVVDLCCGSGAVGLALSDRTPDIDLYSTDIDPAAVRCAAHNLESTPAQVLQGDLFAALPPALAGGVDLIVANAPYVPTDAVARMPAEARLYESRIALDGGADGLDVHRRIAAEAPRWLAPRGWVLVETSDRQAPVTAALFAATGLHTRIHSAATATVVSGTRATASG